MVSVLRATLFILLSSCATAGGALSAELTEVAISQASLDTIRQAESAASDTSTPDASIVKLQVLLDRAGASPGVIDGFMGDNVEKAIAAVEAMAGLPVDGVLDADVLSRLPDAGSFTTRHVIDESDTEGVTGDVPSDYADMAAMDFLGYETVAEKLAERFHMDEDLLAALNPAATYAVGEEIVVVDPGQPVTGEVSHIEADKTLRQVRAYASDGRLLAAYPATIGSTENPSPTGTHQVAAVAPMPEYTYNPDVNFQQGDNAEVLTIPSGPNGPVGSMWIDLTEPTFGIHGTPQPSRIDKSPSHGCIRLTNWDAEELAAMVQVGVPVTFVD
jgi:lipoprotein-anchoring transpeptidase ErfK/SrfK